MKCEENRKRGEKTGKDTRMSDPNFFLFFSSFFMLLTTWNIICLPDHFKRTTQNSPSTSSSRFYSLFPFFARPSHLLLFFHATNRFFGNSRINSDFITFIPFLAFLAPSSISTSPLFECTCVRTCSRAVLGVDLNVCHSFGGDDGGGGGGGVASYIQYILLLC